MSKNKKVFFALVTDLSNTNNPPKILPSKELYVLTPQDEAKLFKPKTESAFKAKDEYGRIREINGKKMMVRHFILKLSEDPKELKAYYDSNKGRLLKPTRRSISPTVEPISKYSFQKPADKIFATPVSKSVKSEGNKLLAKLNAPPSVHKKQVKPVTVDVDVTAPTERKKPTSPIQISGFDITLPQNGKVSSNGPGKDTASAPTEPQNATVVTSSPPKPVKDTIMIDKETQKETIMIDKETQTEKAIKGEEEKEDNDSNVEIKAFLKQISDRQNEILTFLHESDESKSNKAGRRHQKKLSALPRNLIDETEVPEGEIKVAPNRFIKFADVVKAEKNQKTITARLFALLQLFYDKSLSEYSLSGTIGKGTKKMKTACHTISQDEVNSLVKILEHCKWSQPTDLSEAYVRHKIGKITSAVRNPPKNKNEKEGNEPPKAEPKSPEKKSTVKGKPHIESPSESDEGTDSEPDQVNGSFQLE